MRHLATGLLLLYGSATGVAKAEPPEPSSPAGVEENSHVRALCKQAEAAFEFSNFEQARGLFLQAWAIQPSPAIALALGQVELELKRYRDCAEHLEFAIRNIGPTTSESVLEKAKKALNESKARLVVLRVTTNREGAEIRVDGKAVGKAPLSAPLFLDPGHHEISAYFGNSGITRPITAEAGQESSLSLPIVTQTIGDSSLGASLAPVATSFQPAANPGAPDRTQQRSLVPVIIGGATFFAGVATAIVFRMDSDTQFNNADALRTALGRSGCQGSLAATDSCAALMTASQNGDRSRNWSTAGLVIAAGALLGTLAYWYWPASDAQTTARQPNRLQLSARLAKNASGIFLLGEY